MRPPPRSLALFLAVATSARAGDIRILPSDEAGRAEASGLAREALDLRPARRWAVAESPRFRVWAADVPAAVRTVARAERWSATLSGTLGLPGLEDRATVVVLPDADAWARFLARAGLREDSVALHSGRGTILLYEADGWDGHPDRLPHELVHHLLRQAFGRDVPLWLDEGLAGLLGWETVRREAEAQGIRLVRRLAAPEPDRLLPLNALLSVRTLDERPESAMVFYRQSEELVRRLDRRIGRDRLAQWVAALCGPDAISLETLLRRDHGYKDQDLMILDEAVRALSRTPGDVD